MPDTSHNNTSTNLILGILMSAAALLVAFVWIPSDVETGIFEKVRRRLEIGDAFAPTLAAGLLGIGGLLLIIEELKSRTALRIARHNVPFVVGLFVLFVLFTSVMMWSGPLFVALFAEQGSEYRLLRDTAPWKYLGFMIGGTFLVCTLICFVERRFTLQALAIGIGASLALTLLYDFPFEDLLLPPNGDY